MKNYNSKQDIRTCDYNGEISEDLNKIINEVSNQLDTWIKGYREGSDSKKRYKEKDHKESIHHYYSTKNNQGTSSHELINVCIPELKNVCIS